MLANSCLKYKNLPNQKVDTTAVAFRANLPLSPQPSTKNMKTIFNHHITPQDPEEQKKFSDTMKKEIGEYRKRFSFWGGLTIAAIFSFILIYRLDTTGRLIMFPMIFGIALAYDTVTSHFVKKIVQIQESKKSNT